MKIKKGTLVLWRVTSVKPIYSLLLVTGKRPDSSYFWAKDIDGVEVDVGEGKVVSLVQTNGKVKNVRAALKKHYHKIIERLIEQIS